MRIKKTHTNQQIPRAKLALFFVFIITFVLLYGYFLSTLQIGEYLTSTTTSSTTDGISSKTSEEGDGHFNIIDEGIDDFSDSLEQIDAQDEEIDSPTTNNEEKEQATAIATGTTATVNNGNGHHPLIALLMSYPNSGTSFTLKITHTNSNTTVATNYKKETAKRKPKQPIRTVYPGGPYLLTPEKKVPSAFILTKTHCGGYCTDCKPSNYLIAADRFQKKCVKGKVSEIGKVIHLIRNPFDNIVSNFHLWVKSKKVTKFSDDAKGFHQWCSWLEQKYDGAKRDKNVVSPSLIRIFRTYRDVPCNSMIYRYVQWHNNAIKAIKSFDVPTKTMWYDDYEKDIEGTVGDLFSFLELPMVDRNHESFIGGKKYTSWMSKREIDRTFQMIKEVATKDCWEVLKRYK